MPDGRPEPKQRAWLPLLLSLLCYAPTVMAIVGAGLLVFMDLAAWHAVEFDGEDPHLLGFAVIGSLIVTVWGGFGLAILGLCMHTVGLLSAWAAHRRGATVPGLLLALGHAAWIAVDVLFLATVLGLFVTGVVAG